MNDVDGRRRAVARASTLTELLVAHGSIDAFLSTPYGVAYLAHRESVCGWTEEHVTEELGSLIEESHGPTGS